MTGCEEAEPVKQPGLTVVTRQRWRGEELGEVVDVRVDMGLDTSPAEGHRTPLWCPGAWAAAAVSRHPNVRLASAGPEWLDSVPTEVKGRDTATVSAAQLGAALQVAESDVVFAKLPESKHERFEAAVRRPEGLVVDLRSVPEDEPISVQTAVHFTAEVRCWVRDREVVATASYFAGLAREYWPAHDDPQRRAQASRWLQTVLAAGVVDIPAAVVIDVGWCSDPVSGDPGWRVLEANAAWSSDWYTPDDLPAVVETIVASQRNVEERWRWSPSPLLKKVSAGLARR